MAYSQYLAERIRNSLGSQLQVKELKMMGGLIFMINDKMCLGVDMDKKTQTDRLMVRVGKLPYDSLLKERGSKEMDFTGKPMRGFLFIMPEGFDSDEDLSFWVSKALEFNKELAK